MSFDATTQAALAAFDLAAYVQRDGITLQRDGKTRKGLCPFHSEHTPSFTVYPNGDGWYCFGCGRGGSALDYVIDRAEHDRHDPAAVSAGLATLGIGQGARLTFHPLAPRPVVSPPPEPPPPGRAPDCVHIYKNPETGAEAYRVHRWYLTADERPRYNGDDKVIRPYHPGGRRIGLPLGPNGQRQARLLYGLPQVLAADPARWVFLSESESDADAICAAGGLAIASGGAAHWPSTGSPFLAGRAVALLPHQDTAGGEWADRVIHELRPHAATIKVIRLPGLAEHGDVRDFLAAGHTLDALEVLAAYTPALPAVDSATGEIADTRPAPAICDELREALEQVIAERDALATWKAKTLDILFGESALEISDRVSLIALDNLIATQGLPIGQEVPFSGQDTAARLHVSESTVSRYASRWQAMGLAEHRVTPGEPILDKQGRPRFTSTGEPMRRKQAYLSCTAAPYEVAIAVLQSPPGKTGAQHGGARRPCPYCGAAGEKQETITRRRCMECHREYEHDQHVAAPDPQFHDEIAEKRTGFMMKLEAPPVLRDMADDLRRAAPDNPRIAANLSRTRARLHHADQDADAGAYAHEQALAARLPLVKYTDPATDPWDLALPPLPLALPPRPAPIRVGAP